MKKSNTLGFAQTQSLSLCIICILLPQLLCAQTLKPEVMILLDTSSSMQELNDYSPIDAPQYPELQKCNDISQGPKNQPNNAVPPKTKMHTAIEFLTGKANGTQTCVSYSPTYRVNNHLLGRDGNVSHYRLFCHPIGEPNNWIPCWKDYGARVANDPDNPSQKIPDLISSGLNSGLIGLQMDQIKFGLMTMDTNPWKNTDINGDYSFGDSYQMQRFFSIDQGNMLVNQSPYNVVFGLSELSIFNPVNMMRKIARSPLSVNANDGSYLDDFLANQQQEMNLGIRNASAPIGPLIDPNLGTEANRNQAIDETVAQISAHNQWVRNEIRKIVPIGPSPLSAMLEDLSDYYQNFAAQMSSCRQKIVLLITDGSESAYLNSKTCTQNLDCKVANITGPNPDVNNIQGICTAVSQDTSTTSDFLYKPRNCPAGQCPKVCVYPEGSPYIPAIETAKKLYNQGIPVIVLTVGLPDINNPPNGTSLDNLLSNHPALAYSYKIAQAGSPFLGAKTNMPGIYALNDSLDATTLINRIKALNQKKVISETQPLVMNISKTDVTRGGTVDPNLRQWRMASYAEFPIADTRDYGEINTSVLGCQGQVDTSMRLRQIATMSFANKFITQTTRPVFTNAMTSTPQNTVIVPVVDVGQNGLFKSDGTGNQGYTDFIGSAWTPNQVQNIGLQLGGYFGNRGIINPMTAPTKNQRVFGGFNNGDLLGIPPPELYSQKAGMVTAYEKLKTRPSLVVSGSDDGMIHVFRAYDGVNLFSFVPKLSWQTFTTKGAGAIAVDGPLAADNVIPCRAISNSGQNCPDVQNATMTTLVVGGVGNSGANLFGFEIGLFNGEDLRNNPPAINQWPNQAKMWNFTASEDPMLGLSVARPALTHLKVDGQLKAAVVVGCGDDTNLPRSLTPVPNQVGRCVLVIDAMTGALIKKITSNDLNYPMIGGMSVFPQGYGATSDQAFLGDKAGQLWRIDFKTERPDDWTIQRIWPLPIPMPNRPDLQKKLGFSIEERPSIALRNDGRIVILFANAKTKVSALPNPLEFATQGYMASINQRRIINDAGISTFEYTSNWAMDFAVGEFATGAPKIQDGVVYITTGRETNAVGQSCGSMEGKLYGIHYTDSYDQDYMDMVGNRTLRVKPMLPRYEANGTRKSNALSLLLPPGRVSYGFAVVATPPCNQSGALFNELVLNLSQSQEQSALQLNGLAVDYLDGANPNMPQVGNAPPGQLVRGMLGTDLEVRASGSVVNVVLAPPANSVAGMVFRAANPFPSELFYWGNGLNP